MLSLLLLLLTLLLLLLLLIVILLILEPPGERPSGAGLYKKCTWSTGLYAYMYVVFVHFWSDCISTCAWSSYTVSVFDLLSHPVVSNTLVLFGFVFTSCHLRDVTCSLSCYVSSTDLMLSLKGLTLKVGFTKNNDIIGDLTDTVSRHSLI